jgi:AraC-like DNA-binding protein
MDVLSDVLRAVRFTGAIFFDVDATAPWIAATPAVSKIAGAVMPDAEHVISFHAITAGSCWLEVEDSSQPPIRLTAGDIVVFPMGDPHAFCTAPGMRETPDLAIYRRPIDRPLPINIGLGAGDGDRTRFVCGYLGCDARPFNPVLQALPRLLHAGQADGATCVAQLIRLALNETAMRRSGSETMLSKLAELMFVDVVRRYIETLPKDASGWLSGLRDAQVGGALALMHARPDHPWTLETLAHNVGLSRSVFADRFAHFVQDTPMQYLTRWRIQLATRLLERKGVGVAQVAAEVGYESEAAFNRAFKKHVGVPPGAWRRAH